MSNARRRALCRPATGIWGLRAWLAGRGGVRSVAPRARDAWIGWDDTPGALTCTGCLLPAHVPNSCRNRFPTCWAGSLAVDCERRTASPVADGDLASRDRTHRGSVRSSNWVRVRKTRGRGRQDRTHAALNAQGGVCVRVDPVRARLAVPAPVIAPLAAGDGPRTPGPGQPRRRGADRRGRATSARWQSGNIWNVSRARHHRRHHGPAPWSGHYRLIVGDAAGSSARWPAWHPIPMRSCAESRR